MSGHGSNQLRQKGALVGSYPGEGPARVTDSRNERLWVTPAVSFCFILTVSFIISCSRLASKKGCQQLPDTHFCFATASKGYSLHHNWKILKERLTGQACVNALLCLFSRGGVVWQTGYITGQSVSSSSKIAALSSKRKGRQTVQQ